MYNSHINSGLSKQYHKATCIKSNIGSKCRWINCWWCMCWVCCYSAFSCLPYLLLQLSPPPILIAYVIECTCKSLQTQYSVSHCKNNATSNSKDKKWHIAISLAIHFDRNWRKKLGITSAKCAKLNGNTLDSHIMIQLSEILMSWYQYERSFCFLNQSDKWSSCYANEKRIVKKNISSGPKAEVKKESRRIVRKNNWIERLRYWLTD